MADDVDITPGAGATIAADEISGVKYQRVKIIVGADGANDGDVASGNPMPISGVVTNAAATSIDGKITACNTGAVVLATGTDSIGKLAANNGTDIGDVDVPGSTIAHDAVDSGNPHKMGAKALASPVDMTLVADADRTDSYADLDGMNLVKPYTSYGDILSERVSNTNGTSTALTVFGATANAKNFITTIIAHSTSATAGYVDIRDGTGGAIMMSIPLPPGGGCAISFPLPLKQPTANTALAFDVSAAITTVYLSFIGFKSKVA